MRTLNVSLFWIMLGVAGMLPLSALATTPKIGIVIMHGKGGSPERLVNELAQQMKAKGYVVANIEMPWSGKRGYDVDTRAAEIEITQAISSLRAAGATKIFVSGHSQGGAFATHYGATHDTDGVIAIAPGGDPSTDYYSEKISGSLQKARRLVDAGKGNEQIELEDFEGSKGLTPVHTTPNIYLTWFGADGAMNYKLAVRKMNAKTPVLWLVASNDYKAMRKMNIPLFSELPKNPHSKLFEPSSDHKGAPAASVDVIIEWTTAVANGDKY